MRRVLLVGIGEYCHVGAFFRRALESMAYDFAFVDERDHVRRKTVVHKLASRFLKHPCGSEALNRRVIETAERFRPDIALFTKGARISPDTLARIKGETDACLVNFATDDPFNKTSSNSDLVAGIPLYDLCVCTKRAIMEDVRRKGCSNVTFVPFGYEPEVHFPEAPSTPEEQKQFASDVVFVGGADPDRSSIFRHMVSTLLIELHLYGGYWNRDVILRQYHHGFALGREYRLALGGSKIALGLVRHANRDGHSMRTFEIPACGAFMLAERTEEHLELFTEDKEAVYFDSYDEMVDKARHYIGNDAERKRIAEAGHRRVTTGGNTYRDRLVEILELAESIS